jgi:hypothetical protein
LLTRDGSWQTGWRSLLREAKHPIDGNHRIAKARCEGVIRIPARRICCPDHIAFLTTKLAYESYVDYWNSHMHPAHAIYTHAQNQMSVMSRMGVLRVESHTGRTVQLADLVTTRRYTAVCDSGYAGSTGELWFTRVLPPALPDQPEHVVFTSPYVLIAPNPAAWMAYFDRIAAKDSPRPRVEALEWHLKWGPTRRYWTELVFEGYVNHEAGAIYLEGLPDAPESRPHSPQYVRSDQDG